MPTPKHNIFGWKKDRPDHRDRLLPYSSKASPPAVNLKAVCPPIFDQGDCGSCTANASVAMMESLYKIAKKPAPSLSRLYLYYASRVYVEGTAPANDSGCMIRDVMKALVRYGTCHEALWPYDISKFSVKPPEAAAKDAVKNQILNYLSCPTLASIKGSIAAGYPAVIGFSVPENMMSNYCARTGKVRFPASNEQIIGGHAVLAMGFSDASQNIMFQNSWGPNWGDHGFGYLPYTFFIDNGNGDPLASDCWTIRTEEFSSAI